MAVNLLTAAVLLATVPLIRAQNDNTAGHDCLYMQAIPRPDRPIDWPTFNFDGMNWATRPLLPAPDRLDLCMGGYYPESATWGTQLIFMDEEIDEEIAIAKLNYQGTTTPVMHFLSGRNAMLGAVIRQDAAGDWYIYITQRQDFEEGMIFYLFEVHVEGEALVAGVALTIVNIDDNPPWIHVFDPCRVPEQGEAGLTECVYEVTDADGQISTSAMTFEIISDRGDDEIFHITGHVEPTNWFSMNMTIWTTRPLDFEANALHIFTVHALDSLPNVGSSSLMVQVENVEHRPPRWVEVFAVQQFDEKTEREFTVRAIDGDTAIDKPIYYDIITEEGDTFFSISTLEGGRQGGVLHVAPIDRDLLQREVFRLTIVAYKFDNVSFATEANVVIIINDINDQFPRPLQEEYHLSILEETPLTLNFGDQVFGFNDIDLGENAQYDVTLVSVHPANVASAFYVAPEVGYQRQTFIMGTINHAMLDYEVPEFQHIEIQVVATDRLNSSLVGVATVYIDLINWNDEQPLFEADTHTVAFNETEGEGFFVASILATDRDIDDRVVHSLMGNAGQYLRIDETTGDIYVSVDDAFDYHRQNELFVQVRAVDTLGDGPYHTATNQLVIQLLDINNTPPSLRLPRGSPHVEENVPEGYVITTEITATDPDTTAYLRFEIDWDTSYATKQGRETPAIEFHNCVEIVTVHAEGSTRTAHGHLIVKEIRHNVTIDFEEFEVLYLTVRVVDEMTYIGDNFDEMTFTIIIIDMNDNWPIWAEGSLEQRFLVRENATSGVVIGSLLATDIDGPLYNQVRYTIQPIRDTPEDLVKIDFYTGQLTVDLNHAIDADVPPREFLYYSVVASDRCYEEDPDDCPDDPMYWDTPGEISIYITDTNNKEPVPDYERFDVEVRIYEDAAEGAEVVQLVATDQDRECKIMYIYITDTNNKVPVPDYERFDVEVRIYEDAAEGAEVVQLVATDQDRECKIMYIYITDTNNKVPVPDYERFDVEVRIYEDAAEGAEVVQLVATDQDRECKIMYIYITDTSNKEPLSDYERFDVEVRIYEDAAEGAEVVQLVATDQNRECKIMYIYITDTNNKEPLSDYERFDVEVRIYEDAAEGAEVVQLVATDQNRECKIMYIYITDTSNKEPLSDYERFDVEVRIYEDAAEGAEVVQLVATDQNRECKIMYIYITDTNNKEPLSDYERFDVEVRIYEDAAEGAEVVQLVATDQNRECKIMYIYITDTSNKEPLSDYERFDVEVRIYEDAAEGAEVVQLVATDQNRECKIMYIYITDTNNKEPLSDYERFDVEVRIYEDAAEGAEVVQLVATDQNRECKIMYIYITDTNNKEPLSDYERFDVEVRIYEDAAEGAEVVQLVATDQNRECKIMYIYITDTNNKEPLSDYERFDVEVRIYEDAAEGAEVVQLVATDQDRESIYHTVHYQINYAIDPGLRRFFAVDADTGRVFVEFTTDAVLDRDGDEPTHRIFLNLIDNLYSEGEGARNTVAIEVLVILLDVNDNAPELPSPDERSWAISEALLQGVRLSPDIHAHDRDEPFTDNSRVSYEVVGLRAVDRDLTPPSLFTIVTVPNELLWEFRGELETTMDLRGYWGTYEVHIRAYDHGEPMMDSFEWYEISIAPYNYHAPEFVFPLQGTTVRLSKERSVGALWTVTDTLLEYLHATDEDGLHAGEVDFSVAGNAEAIQYFAIENLGDNRGELRLLQTFDQDVREFQVTIRATDRGTDPGPRSTDTVLNVVFVPSLADPTFTTDTATVAFMEQEVNTETQQLPLADDLKNYLCEDDCHPIYYRIADGNNEGHFELDASTNVLRVVRALDREEAMSHRLVVAASNSPTSTTATQGSLLAVIVNVREANPRPVFARSLYTAGISTLDTIGRVLLTVQAPHSENAPVTYSIDSASMQVDSSLEAVRELAFQLHPQTGALTLQVQPTASMHGMFEFDVVAEDPVGATDTAEVKVYLISSRNRVSFIFVNTVEEIEEDRDFIADTFSTAFNMTCNIDQVTPDTDPSGVALAHQTDVRAHLIRDDIPVPAEEIEFIRADTQLLFTIQMALRTRELQLLDFVTELSPEASSDASLITIYVLAALSAVLGFLCLLLLLTFIIRTRTLNRRLEALSMTKYGSVDSGLNRKGLAAPGTNKYATEGANPIWNETFKAPDFDAISDASGDSDLIGIEDLPQFRSNYFPPGDTSSTQGLGDPVGVHKDLANHSNNFGFYASPFSQDFSDRQFRRN